MTVLMTGFPGFLGSALLPRILTRTGGEAVCLVQGKFSDVAARRRDELVAADRALDGRIHLIEGDITRPGLGIDDPSAVLEHVTELWHLAAVYDLAVERDLAMRVNTEGTRYTLDVAAHCPNLERFQYFSTCYVSGRHPGPFREDDLLNAGPFNNYYEETKHYAEVEVRRRMADGMPATIYRPSIVVGDSVTGATQKYDGPYFVLQLLLRQRRVGFLPSIGDMSSVCMNVVPRDFLLDAVAYLAGLPNSEGRTYQLADPDPLTVRDMFHLFGEVTGRRVVLVPLPRRLTRKAVARVPGVEKLLRLPAESLDYITHPTYYLTDHVQADLAGSGIEVPRLAKYAEHLVDFMRAHPEFTPAAMV